MRASRELREPFLDHRMVELALRQPATRKVNAHTGKVFLRELLRDRLPGGLVEAPKRPVQTPQREWLRGPLQGWVRETVEDGIAGVAGDWLDVHAVRQELERFFAGEGDNSFFVWQWVTTGLLLSDEARRDRAAMSSGSRTAP